MDEEIAGCRDRAKKLLREKASVIESNMSLLRLAEPLQHVNRRLCSSWTALELFEL